MTKMFRKTLVLAVTTALLSGYNTISLAADREQGLTKLEKTTISDDMYSENMRMNSKGNQPHGMPPTGAPPKGKPPMGKPPVGMPPAGGSHDDQGKKLSDFTAVNMVDGMEFSLNGGSFLATKADQNVALVKNSGRLNMDKVALKKLGDTTSPDGSNFSGQNAVFLAADSTASLTNSTIYSAAEGANGVFATGKNAKIEVENLKINTTKNSSRGLDATYGGTIIAKNVDITTWGAHCAALATDRGEGTVTVSDSKLTTAGEGSPCIYSTGNITVTNSSGQATGNEIAAIEGKNSITLDKVNLSGSMKHGIMLYQSFSGDADTGTASLTVTNSTLKSTADGPMFYVTNTKAKTNIANTKLSYNNKELIKVTSDQWGTTGANGGDYTFTATNQQLKGSIYANEISSVNVNLKEGTKWQGVINKANIAKDAQLHLDKSAKWNMTGTSYLTVFTDRDQSLANISSHGYNIIYDSSNSGNAWLHGRTRELPGGGKLMPQM